MTKGGGGTNHGGGPRWGSMPRGTCPRCGLNKFVGVLQGEEKDNLCNNVTKCTERMRRRTKRKGGA